MKRYFLPTLVLAFGTLWLSSCKSGTTNPNEPANLLPLTEGNYWVYERYELDSNEQRTGAPTYDSVVVGAAIQLAGRQAYPLYSFSDDDTHDTTYLSKDAEGNIWQYMDFSAGDAVPGFELPALPPRWVKIVSVSSETSWTTLDTTLTLQVPGIPIPQTLSIKVTNAKAGTDTVTVSSKSYTAQKFTMTYDVRVASLGNFSGTTTYSYVASIGRAKDRSITTINIPLAGITNQKSGSEAVLIRYYVK